MKIIHSRPRIVVSKCLGFAPCRWNGDSISDEYVEALKPHVDFAPVCPEMEIGLGAPRKPIRLVEEAGRVWLLQHETGLDCTGGMEKFCRRHLDGLKGVDGFILKGRSPSCGPNDVKIYMGREKGAASRRGPGLFGGMVKECFAHLAWEHEGRLKNFSLREHFYTKVFTLARFRHTAMDKSMGGLVKFQADNKLLFMAYNQTQAKVLGRITANPQRLPVEKVLTQYAKALPLVMARPIRFTSAINALMHAMGYFSKELSKGEKAHFLEAMEEYRQGRTPLSALLTLLTSWIARFDEAYLGSQTFFQPYPAELVEITDSGKGRSG